jgi:RNA polymerase sigma-70 factor (ECF subfamily)
LRGFGLSSADAEDATQRVFMVAASKLDSVDPERARSFLYGTAIRVGRNARRTLLRRREVASDVVENEEPVAEGPERTVEMGRARALLAELMGRMPEKLRTVLVLAEIEQLEIREIAALEGIPVGTAASRLRLGRERFRALLVKARHRNPFAVES